jgi:hypothetical protein
LRDRKRFGAELPCDACTDAIRASISASASIDLKSKAEYLTGNLEFLRGNYKDAVSAYDAMREAGDPAQDPSLAFQPPADGTYTVRVAERFRSRGGPNFAYRLRITDGSGEKPGFRLTVPFDTRRGPDGPPPDPGPRNRTAVVLRVRGAACSLVGRSRTRST